MEKLPQALVNVRVADRDGLEGAASGLGGGRARGGSELEGRGRVLCGLRDGAADPRDGRGADRGGVRGVVGRLAEVVRAELGSAEPAKSAQSARK